MSDVKQRKQRIEPRKTKGVKQRKSSYWLLHWGKPKLMDQWSPLQTLPLIDFKRAWPHACLSMLMDQWSLPQSYH